MITSIKQRDEIAYPKHQRCSDISHTLLGVWLLIHAGIIKLIRVIKKQTAFQIDFCIRPFTNNFAVKWTSHSLFELKYITWNMHTVLLRFVWIWFPVYYRGPFY